jgi:hypothetical protein
MHTLLAIVAGLAFAFTSSQSLGYDDAVAAKWSAAKIIKYHVEGRHEGRESVVLGDYEGKADVIDSVTVDFTWDLKARKMVGPIVVTDGKSELRNIKSDETNCPPPQLKGDYELFQSVSNSMTSADQIQIAGKRIYPAASVSNYPGSCSMRSIPGGKEDAVLWVPVTGAEVLGAPNRPGSPVTIAADRKSFTMKGAEGWSWTYTPTLVQ